MLNLKERARVRLRHTRAQSYAATSFTRQKSRSPGRHECQLPDKGSFSTHYDKVIRQTVETVDYTPLKLDGTSSPYKSAVIL